ncbi:MAG: hypothetical protein EOP85_11020, partial [Verrucomicrobiaceae bacterium]
MRWEARIARELGDMTFRETGGGLQPRQQGNGQVTASAYYQQARLVLYQARLIDGRDKSLNWEAHELEDRIRWIRAGLPYGGMDFYQFAAYRPGGYLTDHEAKLRELIAILQQRTTDSRRDLAAAQSQLESEANASAGREQLEEQFKTQMNFHLRSRMSDMSDRILDLKSERARAALDLAGQELEIFGLSQGLELDQMKYRGELERERQRVSASILDVLVQLRSLGGAELIRATVPDERWTQVEAFMRSHPSGSVRESWELWQGPNAPRTLQEAVGRVLADIAADRPVVTNVKLDGDIASRKASWIRASKELELAISEREFFEAREELKQQNDTITSLDTSITDLNKQLESLPDQLTKEELQSKRASVYDYLKERALPHMDSDWKRANDRVNKLKANLADFRGEVKKARETVDKIKKAAETVEKAYDRFKGILDSVSFQPVVIGGTLSGSYVDFGAAFDRLGKAALQKVQDFYSRMKDSKDVDAFLLNLEEEAKAAEDNISATQQEAEKKKEEFENKLRDKTDLQKFVPTQSDKSEFNAILAKIDEARNKIVMEVKNAGVGTYPDDSDSFQRKKKEWAEAAIKASGKAKDAVG